MEEEKLIALKGLISDCLLITTYGLPEPIMFSFIVANLLESVLVLSGKDDMTMGEVLPLLEEWSASNALSQIKQGFDDGRISEEAIQKLTTFILKEQEDDPFTLLAKELQEYISDDKDNPFKDFISGLDL